MSLKKPQRARPVNAAAKPAKSAKSVRPAASLKNGTAHAQLPGAEGDAAYAREVLLLESQAIASVMGRANGAFSEAVQRVLDCTRAGGRVVVTGMGKPGFIAQKISATFSSTGTPSLYLHPAEALHGDLGRLAGGDLVLALSNSGETDEVVRLLPALERLGMPIIALTSDAKSRLARAAAVVLEIGPTPEACPLGLAPTTSTVALLALGDALAMTVLHRRGFSVEQFAELHPGGALGKRLMRVREVMRTGRMNPVVAWDQPLREAVAVMTRTEGRPGATSIVDRQGKLVGIFTDGDLRRLVEEGPVDFNDPIRSVMGRSPRTVGPDDLATTAADLLREGRIDQVPVVDDQHRPVGLLDVQDLLAARLLA
ncbi:MAG: KpsF/GutQ family sugar-phosphate isomerase [Deltaproteobacteria bacterium]|nr:KpsF/GutQ family sugar-phosphate isomerase [Deltaproteobacteria bacterium]